MKLQMNKGTSCHGEVEYVVNNHTWVVELPDEVGRFVLVHCAGLRRLRDVRKRLAALVF